MKDSKQMELIPLTSSQEDIHANHSRLQENKKVLKIRDTFGQSILDLSKNVGRLGLLEKMLVDTLNSVSTPLSRTWKVKITPSDHLVFQLRASVPTTKEKESGLWLTPSATTISTRSKESMEKRKKYRESIGRTTVPPGNLAEQIQYGKPTTEMWATPQSTDGTRANQIRHPSELSEKAKKGGCSNLREQVMWRTPDAHSGRGPSSEKRMKMKLDKGMPISINDQVAHPHLMWPTPRTGGGSRPNQKGGKVPERGSIDSRGIEGERKDIERDNKRETKNMANTDSEGSQRPGLETDVEGETNHEPTRRSEQKGIFSDAERLRQQGQREFIESLDPTKATTWQTIEFINGCIQGEWPIEPNVGRVANGVPKRVDRLKSLGNSLVPQIPYYIGCSILESLVADTNGEKSQLSKKTGDDGEDR